MASVAPWPKEEIPDKDYLFQRVHKNHIVQGTLAVSMVFKNYGEGMSTEWSHYSSAQKTKNRVAKLSPPKDPKNYGVINLKVKEVRKISGQTVVHTPLKENRAHTDIKGEKTEKAKVLFSRIYDWSIKPPVPVIEDSE